MTQPVPTTIINGFLGSGKTTIITHLVAHLRAQDVKVVYIKNEIGDEDLDTKLIAGENIQTKELLNGCICCTLVGSFVASVNEICETFQPERILIESAGTADPASLALTVSHHPLLSRDGVLTVIDVVNFDGFPKLDEVTRRQASLTDLIVFNKVEQADLDRKRAVVGYVRELNQAAPIVEAPHGKVDPGLVFGISSGELEALLTQEASHGQIGDASSAASAADATHAMQATHAHHQEEDQVQARTFVTQQPLHRQTFEAALKQLPKQVIRIKGVVVFGSETLVLNGVFQRFDYAALPPALAAKNHTQQLETRLILIGYKVNQISKELDAWWQQATMPGE